MIRAYEAESLTIVDPLLLLNPLLLDLLRCLAFLGFSGRDEVTLSFL